MFRKKVEVSMFLKIWDYPGQSVNPGRILLLEKSETGCRNKGLSQLIRDLTSNISFKYYSYYE